MPRVTERIWNFVWWRRITYFATLTSTLLLLAMPLFVGRLPTPPVLADGRTGIGGVIRLSTLVLPNFASKGVEVYANNPFYFFLLVAVIYMFLQDWRAAGAHPARRGASHVEASDGRQTATGRGRVMDPVVQDQRPLSELHPVDEMALAPQLARHSAAVVS